MKSFEYIIVGDYNINGKVRSCLVRPCDTDNFDKANMTLSRMKNNPNENDLALIRIGKNLRLEKLPKKDCWWNDYTD